MAKQTAKDACWIISPDGIPVYAVAHARAVVRGSSTVDADLARIEATLENSGNFTATEVILNPDAWQEFDSDSAQDGFFSVIPVTGVTEATYPLICISPDSSEEAARCGFRSECLSGTGTVTVYAKMPPADTITITIFSMFSQNREQNIEVNAPDAPAVAYYKLPVATKDVLGGVKIGDNIDIAEDGTISAKRGSCNHVLSGGPTTGDSHIHDADCFKDMLASPEEVEDVLNRALGIDAEGPEESDNDSGHASED